MAEAEPWPGTPDGSHVGKDSAASRNITIQSSSSREKSKLPEESNSHIVYMDDLDDADNMDHFGSRFVMHEKNSGRLAWSVVVCMLLVYVASIFLYRFAFWTFHIGPNGLDPVNEEEMVWIVIDYIIDALFWVDLIITFFMTYKDRRGREVDSLKLIAKNYLSFYFWLNLLACLPEQAYSSMFPAADDADEGPGMDFRVARVYRLQRVSRLARLTRVTRLFKLAQIMSTSHLWKKFQSLRGVRVVNFITGLFWALHCLACGWYLCAALHDDVSETWVARRAVSVDGRSLLESDSFEQWLVSMYFVLTVFTTVGFGDISAGTEAEIVYVALTMLVGAVVHSIIISEVIGIVTSTDEVQKVVAKQLSLIDAYTAHTQLSAETSKAMKSEISWRATNWAVSHGFDKSEMKALITGKYMPRWLIAEVPQSLFGGRLIKNNFLRCVSNVPPRLPCLLALNLMSCDFEAGEALYQMGDYPFNLFLVMHGTFTHVARPTQCGGIDATEVDELKVCGNGSREECEARASRTSLEESKAIQSEPSSTGSHHLYPYRLYSFGSYFGEVEMIAGKPRTSTTRCERRGSTLTLHKKDFNEMEEMFPQFGAAWQSVARRRERLRVLSLAKLTKQCNYKSLAAMRIQQHFHQTREHTSPEQGANERKLSEVSYSRVLRGGGVISTAQTQAQKTQVALDTLRLEMRTFRKEVLGLLKGQNSDGLSL